MLKLLAPSSQACAPPAPCPCSCSTRLLPPASCSTRLPSSALSSSRRRPPLRLRFQAATALPSSPSGGGGGEPEDSNHRDGNLDVQDALADILDMEIRKSKVKQDIMDDLEQRKDRLREIGEELTADFGKEIELDKMRMELASNMSLAETMDKFQQLEDEVQAVRDQLQADKRDLASWEERTMSAKNRGLFFQKLYKSSDKKEGAEGGDKEATARIIADIKQPVEQELRSPWRLYAFAYLGCVSGAVLVADLLSGSPSYAADALHAAVVVLMAFSVWSERRALDAAGKQDV